MKLRIRATIVSIVLISLEVFSIWLLINSIKSYSAETSAASFHNIITSILSVGFFSILFLLEMRYLWSKKSRKEVANTTESSLLQLGPAIVADISNGEAVEVNTVIFDSKKAELRYATNQETHKIGFGAIKKYRLRHS